MEKLMATGMSRDAAINKIRSAYGWRCSVTQIINFIIANHQNGGHGHPNLVDLTPYLWNGGRHRVNMRRNSTRLVLLLSTKTLEIS
jgi:hypothetical protein